MFAEHANRKYGVDMAGLDEAYDSECVEFFSLSSLWRELADHQVISGPTVVKGACFASMVGICRCQQIVCVNCRRMAHLWLEYVVVNLWNACGCIV